MLAVLAAALFSTIALLATALFALLAQLNGFRAEVNGRFDAVDGRFDAVTSDVADLKAGLARVEQKLDDHLAGPHPAH
jgi:hypothetical protein